MKQPLVRHRVLRGVIAIWSLTQGISSTGGSEGGRNIAEAFAAQLKTYELGGAPFNAPIGRDDSPLTFWEGLVDRDDANLLAQFAIHILSILPTSITDEAQVSIIEWMTTFRRNRLSPKTIVDLYQLRAFYLSLGKADIQIDGIKLSRKTLARENAETAIFMESHLDYQLDHDTDLTFPDPDDFELGMDPPSRTLAASSGVWAISELADLSNPLIQSIVKGEQLQESSSVIQKVMIPDKQRWNGSDLLAAII